MREKAIIETCTDFKVKLRFLLLTLILVVFYTTLLFSATIYIDPTNTATGQNGTINNPYQSWNQVTFTNGNVYLQKRGTNFYTSGGITITGRNNITLGAYDTGEKPRIISSGGGYILDLTAVSNCIIQDLEISSTGNATSAVLIDGYGTGTSPDNLIQNCDLHSCEWGIRILTNAPGNRILNCNVYNTGDDGIYAKDITNLEIGYCNVYDVNMKYFINPDQSYSAGDCIQLVSLNTNLFFNIHHNNLDHSSAGNKFCFIAAGENYSGIMEYNTFTGNSDQVTSCLYFGNTSGTVTVRYNTIQDGNYGIYSYVDDLQLHYNKIIRNNLGVSILADHNLTALNNVFYNNTTSCIASISNTSVISKNNIFYLMGSSARAYSCNSAINSDYNNFNTQQNNFLNSYSTLSAWQNATGNDLHSYIANPQFVDPGADNYCLLSNSPCINSGTNVNLQFDLFGTQVPQANIPDIGYHEYLNNSGGSNQPPVINNQSFQINENSANNSIVGTVVANDPNSGQSLTYSITGGNTNNAFAINANTGVLTVANSQAINYELINVFPLIIRVNDNGPGNLWSQATVSVILLNVNENPIIANQTFNIVQNIANGTLVGTVQASDPDQGQSLSYTITSGNTNNAFAINSTNGNISVLNALALVQNQFSLTVRATDNGVPVLWSAATITISVGIVVNLAPTIPNQSFTTNQSTPNGTLVGQVAASDPNAGQTLTYSIYSGNTNNAFAINSNNGNISVNNSTALTPQTFSLIVRVTDNGVPVLWSQATISIIVVGSSNTAPLVFDQYFDLALGAPNGTLIGTILASDPNVGQSLTYSITSGNYSNSFFVNATSGNLFVSNSGILNEMDYELTIRVTDNGSPVLWSQATVTISVIGTTTNHPPAIVNQSFGIVQYSPNGTFVGNVVATDPDQGQTLIYSLISGNTNSAFSINSSNGNLTVNNSSSLSPQVFSLVVRVTDNGNPTLYSQATVTVNVTSPQNMAPVIANQSFNIAINSPNGSQIGTVVATDPNTGQTLTYSIISGNSNAVFAINTGNGNLTVNNTTLLSVQSYQLTVRVTDNGSPVLWSQATITVNVTQPVNQVPVIANQTFSIVQYSPNGTLVGQVVASDPNSGQTLTYSIVSGNNNNAFTINSSNGNIIVNNSASLSIQTFSLIIRVTDNGTPNLYSQATITIVITSPPNQAPIIANQSFSLSANSPNGTYIGTVVASDPNSGQTITYSITSGNSNNLFQINSTSGILTVSNTSAISTGTYIIFVRVTDNGSPVLWSQANITITVTQPANMPPIIANQTFNINENRPNGTSVGTIVAIDPNQGQSLTYSIVSGNVSNTFIVNPISGLLTVNNSAGLNYEITPVFSLIVRVTDNGTGNLWSQSTITVNLINLNEVPVLNEVTFTVAQFAPAGTFIGVVTGTDPDAGQSLTFQIVSGNTSNAFNLNASNGALNVVNSAALNLNVNPVFYLNIRVSDNGSPSLYSVGTVRISIVTNKNSNEIVDFNTDNVANHVFTIYPNPSADGIFNITSDTEAKISEIQVYNTSGQLINRIEKDSEIISRVDLSLQSYGIYILRIIAEEKSYTLKAIKK